MNTLFDKRTSHEKNASQLGVSPLLSGLLNTLSGGPPKLGFCMGVCQASFEMLLNKGKHPFLNCLQEVQNTLLQINDFYVKELSVLNFNQAIISEFSKLKLNEKKKLLDYANYGEADGAAVFNFQTIDEVLKNRRGRNRLSNFITKTLWVMLSSEDSKSFIEKITKIQQTNIVMGGNTSKILRTTKDNKQDAQTALEDFYDNLMINDLHSKKIGFELHNHNHAIGYCVLDEGFIIKINTHYKDIIQFITWPETKEDFVKEVMKDLPPESTSYREKKKLYHVEGYAILPADQLAHRNDGIINLASIMELQYYPMDENQENDYYDSNMEAWDSDSEDGNSKFFGY